MHDFQENGSVESQLRFIGPLEAQNALFEAVSKAKAKFESVAKSMEGQIGLVKFRYADLHALVEATRGPLSEQGVAVMQFLNGGAEGECVLTTVVAGQGAQIHSALSFPRAGDVKEFGKQSTYLRRYAYQAALLLDGDRDADQDGQESPPMKRREPPQATKPQGQNGGRYGQGRAHQASQPQAQPPAQQTLAEAAKRATSVPPPPQGRFSTHPPPAPQEAQRPTSRAPAPPASNAPAPGNSERRLVLRQLLMDAGWTRLKVGEFCFEHFSKAGAELNESEVEVFIEHMQQKAGE